MRPNRWVHGTSVAASVAFVNLAAAQCPADSWSLLANPTADAISGIAFGNGLYIAVGEDAEILTSTNGTVWSDAGTAMLNFNYLAVEFADGQFVACGSDGRVDVLTGPNAGAVSFGSGTTFADVAFGGGVWVAVGGTFDINAGWFEVIISSTDGGVTWQPTLFEQASGPLSVLFGVAHGFGFVVAAGDGTIRTSSDGITWSARRQIASDLNFIEFGDRFIAGGAGGILRSSFAGSSWQNIDFGSNAWFDAAYSGGRWVIAGQSGLIAESVNSGQSWTMRTSGTSSAIEVVAVGPPAWVAGGTSNPGGQLLLASECPNVLLPDLAPFSPAGWSDSLVLSVVPGTNTDAATITDADQIYIDLAWANLGAGSASAFEVSVQLDGGGPTTIPSGGLQSGFLQTVTDLTLGPLPAGSYQISFTVDSGDIVSEENESNNVRTRTFTVAETVVPCPGDANGSGFTDTGDLLIVLANFNTNGKTRAEGDLTGEGDVNTADLLEVLANFDTACD